MLGYYIGNVQHTRVYKYLRYVGAGKNSSRLKQRRKCGDVVEYIFASIHFPKISYYNGSKSFGSSLTIYPKAFRVKTSRVKPIYLQNQRSCCLAFLPHARPLDQERTHSMVSDVARVVVEMEA